MTSPFPDCTCGAPDDAEPEDHDTDCPETPGGTKRSPTMADLNHHNVFAFKGERTGRFYEIDYVEAWQRLQGGEDVYEKVLPDRSYTPREKAQIPWTLVKLVDDQ